MYLMLLTYHLTLKYPMYQQLRSILKYRLNLKFLMLQMYRLNH
jgi:hypothetical protein